MPIRSFQPGAVITHGDHRAVTLFKDLGKSIRDLFTECTPGLVSLVVVEYWKTRLPYCPRALGY